MSVESKFFAALTSSTTLGALVSTRVYPVPLPQGVSSFPSLTYERQGGDRVNTLSGYAGLEKAFMAVSIYATSLVSIGQTSSAVIAALSSSTAFSSLMFESPEDDWDDELQQRVRFLEISLWNRE